MRVALISVSALALFALLPAGCASNDDGGLPQDSELTTATAAQPIVGACNANTAGLPCDPDGPLGALLECEGVCLVNSQGAPACVTLTALGLSNQNGAACGTTDGVGNAACARRCAGRTCEDAPATAGAACRPDASSNPCEASCNGAGVCEPLTGSACVYGRVDEGCRFRTCNPANVTQCRVLNLPAGTQCDDANLCTIGQETCAAGGVCTPGTPKSCDDGRACTTDVCVPATGACVGTANTAPCSDNNRCTVGDVCANFACTSGAPVSCEDNNACTTETGCSPTQGCLRTTKVCSDSDPCTTDTCRPADGECVFTRIAGCGQDAGTDGGGGTGGTDGGAGTGGTDGGAGTGGTDGGAGTGGTDGGAGTGGTDGGAGTDGGGGVGGTDGGAGTGGIDGGAGGTGGGAGTGGTAGSAGSSGSGGSSGSSSGGTGGARDAGLDGGSDDGGDGDDDGCSCSVPAKSSGNSGLMLVGLAAAIAVVARRRR